jgi:hypothetical protein
VVVVLEGGAGGVARVLGAGLFGFEAVLGFPLLLLSPLSSLSPLEKGHRCRLAALRVANSHLQDLHDRCGLPTAASAEAFAAFRCSCLDARFLFRASRLFSFRARVVTCWPLVRSKKA